MKAPFRRLKTWKYHPPHLHPIFFLGVSLAFWGHMDLPAVTFDVNTFLRMDTDKPIWVDWLLSDKYEENQLLIIRPFVMIALYPFKAFSLGSTAQIGCPTLSQIPSSKVKMKSSNFFNNNWYCNSHNKKLCSYIRAIFCIIVIIISTRVVFLRVWRHLLHSVFNQDWNKKN